MDRQPIVLDCFLVAAPMAAGAIFAFGQWKGRVDSDRALFKGLMAEVRNDIKQILRRLPSSTVAAHSPLRLTGQIHFRMLRDTLSSSTRLGGIDAVIRMIVISIGRI